MRNTYFCFVAIAAFSTLAVAETSLLKTTIDVDIGGRLQSAPLELSGDQLDGNFIISAETEISGISFHAAAAFQDAINRKGDCEQRWSAWDTQVGVTGDALFVASTIRVEQWVCKRIFGRELKTRLGGETGRVEAHIATSIKGGRPQLTLAHFRVHDLGSISRALRVENYVQREIQKEIDKVNANPKLTETPALIKESGYRYHQAKLRRGNDGRSYAVASIIGPNDALALAKLIGTIADLTR